LFRIKIIYSKNYICDFTNVKGLIFSSLICILLTIVFVASR
jgi:hypothetical protein